MTHTERQAAPTNRRGRNATWLASIAALIMLMSLWPSWVPTASADPLVVRQGTAQPSTGPASPLQVSLADLGFTTDIVMRGARAGTRVGLPLPRQGLQSGRLHLRLDVSPVVHPSATVQVTMNGRPAGAFTVAQLRESPTVEIPVPPTQEPYLDVDMNGALFSSVERCVQENDASLWMVLGRDSRLLADRAPAVASVADFLSVPGGVVAVQGRWDTPAAREATIALFGTVQHVLRDRGSRVILAEDAATLTPTDRQGSRTVVLAGDTDPLARLDGQTLHVSLQRAALDALTTESASVLRTGQAIPAVSRVEADRNPIVRAVFGPIASYRRDLSALGLPTTERTGTGVLATPIRFTVADLGGWPSDLMLDLDARFDEVDASSLDRALLRVRLNGTLIETADLRGRTSYQKLIALPAAALQPSNQLDLDFVYAPATGNCMGSPIAFNGQISGGSGLTWSGYGPGRGVLPEVIGSLDNADLVLADDAPELAQTAARLVGGLSRLAPRPVAPRLVGVETLGQRRAGVTTLVLGGTSESLRPLGLPVVVGPGLDIVETRTNTTVLQGSLDRPLVAAQYMAGASPVLAILSSPGADPRLLDGAVRELVDPARFFSWSGNVVLGVPGDLLSVDLNGGALRARQEALWDWRVLLARFRWVVAAVAIVIVLVGCWVTYRRLGQQRTVPAPASTSGA